MRRRSFLLAAGSAAAAISLSACSDNSDNDTPDDAEPGRQGGGEELPEADLDALAFAAGLEVLAVQTYRAARDAFNAGALGQVPAVGVEFVDTAVAHHDQCLDLINGLLQQGSQDPVAEPNEVVKSTLIDPALAAAKSFVEIATVARTLETATAATYLRAIQSQLQSPEAIRTAAGIQSTGQKRVAVLNFLLGTYPVPDTFQKTDTAISP